MHVFFEDDGAFKAGTVLADNDTSLQVEAASGKRLKIKAAHVNFHAQPKPEKIPAVKFNQNYRIVGAERWQGPQYEVFRTYQPVWHDSGWYQSNFA